LCVETKTKATIFFFDRSSEVFQNDGRLKEVFFSLKEERKAMKKELEKLKTLSLRFFSFLNENFLTLNFFSSFLPFVLFHSLLALCLLSQWIENYFLFCFHIYICAASMLTTTTTKKKWNKMNFM
jgi:ABC-type uncharacterized transport system fused permease/ATPase subunit